MTCFPEGLFMAKNKDKEVQLTASEKMTQSVDSWLGRHIKLIASIVIAVVAVIVIAAIVTVVVNNNQSKRYEKLDAVTASYAEFSAMLRVMLKQRTMSLLEQRSLPRIQRIILEQRQT